MEINAGFIIWAVLVLATMLLLLASLRSDAPKARQVHAVAVVLDAADEQATPEESPEAKETRHWVAVALNKLGYTKGEAQRMAALVPAGYTLQDGIQYCLRNRGGK